MHVNYYYYEINRQCMLIIIVVIMKYTGNPFCKKILSKTRNINPFKSQLFVSGKTQIIYLVCALEFAILNKQQT